MPYFDYNATAPLLPAARQAWLEASDEAWQNPSSPTTGASRARRLLEQARQELADLLTCEPDQLVFNSGATEGNNAVFRHLARLHPAGTVIISAVEHPCVREAARATFGERVRTLPVDPGQPVAPARLENMLAEQEPVLVSVMAANNETGILQPWEELADLCRRKGVAYHCDAAQWLGKNPGQKLGRCDFLTGCAHKFGGPRGTGFLKLGHGHAGFRALHGGEQENSHRAGTENVPGVLAMLSALRETQSMLQEAPPANRAAARDTFERVLKNQIQGTRIVGEGSPRLWNTSSLILPRHQNERWVSRLDHAGFAVSTGSACATGKEGPSPVLAAHGFTEDQMRRAVRVSGGWTSTGEDWDLMAEAFIRIATELDAEDGSTGPGQVIAID